MTSRKKKSTQKEINEDPVDQPPPNKSWIPMNAGIGIITIVSILMAVLTAWQAIPERGWLNGGLLGLVFGGMIWIVFLGMQLFYRLTGPKR